MGIDGEPVGDNITNAHTQVDQQGNYEVNEVVRKFDLDGDEDSNTGNNPAGFDAVLAEPGNVFTPDAADDVADEQYERNAAEQNGERKYLILADECRYNVLWI